jgi:hypothetical protein
MALKTFFINSTEADYGEEEFNYLQKFLLDQGVLHTQGADWADFVDLEVAENDTPDMNIKVAKGNAVIETERNSVTFKVFVFNNAIETLAVGANTSGVDRVDAVVLKLSRTTEPNSLMNNVANLEVVAGTGASAMSDADIQTALGADYDFIRLANITVADSATTITDADIGDTRERVLTTDAIQYSPTVLKFKVLTTDPASPAEGEVWYNSTDNKMRYYDGTAVINLEASVFTGGDGIDITSGSISIDLATDSSLEFASGKLKVTKDAINLFRANQITSAGTWSPISDLPSLAITQLFIDATITQGSLAIEIDGVEELNITSALKEWYLYEPESSLEVIVKDDVFNLASASYDDVSFSIPSGSFSDLYISPDGTRMYLDASSIYQYTLSTPWDLSTASDTGKTFAHGVLQQKGLYISPDGVKMYVSGIYNDDIAEFTLSTPWDVTTATETNRIYRNGDGPSGLHFKPDGTQMYWASDDYDKFYQESLSTPWDISTAVNKEKNKYYGSTHSNPTRGIWISDDGTKLLEMNSNAIYYWEFSTPWDITTLSYINNFSVSIQDSTQAGIDIKPDGTKAITSGGLNDKAYQYTIGNLFDGKINIALNSRII